jgi:hypothetical protein
MSEMQEDPADDQTNPALDDFAESVAKVNDGLSEMISCALRMQMLVMEDARNMIAEFRAVTAAAGARGTNSGDI